MNESTTHLKDTTANPAPLGLLGFGMTTVLLNLHNAGFYELNSMILAMGDLLWWRGSNCGWDYGMAERQYFRHDCFSFVRPVLVLTRGADYSAEVRMGDSVQRHCDGGLSFHMGSVHCSDAHSHVAFACCRPGRFRFADDSFLSPDDWRFR